MTDDKSIAGLDYPDQEGFEQICGRLKEVTQTNSDRALFEALGFKPNSAYGALKRQQVQPAWIVSAVTRFGASAKWLIFGSREQMGAQAMPIVELQIDRRNKVKIIKSEKDFLLKSEWLETKGGQGNLLLVRAIEDVMEPTIMARNLVLVNTALNTPQSGGIFAMAYNKNWHFKRLLIEPGRLMMLSDKEIYPPIEVEFTDGRLPENVKVIGRAVCWWHEEMI